MRALFSLTGLVLAASVCSAAGASTLTVQFVDGRTLVVDAVERGQQTATLTLVGGGQLAVPAARIANWDGLAEMDRQNRVEAARADRERREAQLTWRRAAGGFAEIIQTAADRHGVDPVLLTAVAEVESAFNERAVSHKGAQGLMQLIPQTAARFGVDDPFDPAQNVSGGAHYLRWLLDRYEGDVEMALAGYNAGEGAVDRYQGIPPYRETRDYVVKVLDGIARIGRRASGAVGGGSLARLAVDGRVAGAP